MIFTMGRNSEKTEVREMMYDVVSLGEFIIDFTARFGILLMMPRARYVAGFSNWAHEDVYAGQNEGAGV